MKKDEIKQVQKFYAEFLSIWEDVKHLSKAEHRLINDLLNYLKTEFNFSVAVERTLNEVFLKTVWNFLCKYKRVGLRFLEFWLRYHARL
ncbi:MAG: hypothetical protein QXT86_11475 [Archaeoglobaceae archaeon]